MGRGTKPNIEISHKLRGEQYMLKDEFNKHIDVDRIPTLPAIAIEAIKLMEGESSSFESVADLLQNDQVLSGRILHYANTAFIGARNKITTIARAISLLGFNTVRSLILSVSVFDCFAKGSAEQQEGLVKFWLHSIAVAVTSEILANKLGFSSPDEAYLAGLVHDIGKLVCYLQMPADFAMLCQELSKQGGYSIDGPLALGLEKEAMGIDHTEVGRIVAEQWLFPESMVSAMWLHHQPVPGAIDPASENIYQLIHFADVICVAHNIGSSYFLCQHPYDHQHYHFSLENLLLHHNLSGEMDSIIEEVMERVDKVAGIIGLQDKKAYHELVASANVSLGSMSLNLDRQNQTLLMTNQVLDATNKMTRRLVPGMSISGALQEIIMAACEAFGCGRCICMALDDDGKQFIGQLYSGGEFNEFTAALDGMPSEGLDADIKSEAIRELRKATVEFSNGGMADSGVAEILAGSEFLASFFIGNRMSHGRSERIIGELLVDFQGVDLRAGQGEINRNFELLASTAANGIERILLEKDLRRQAKKMAADARKIDEHQRQLFNTHRLATVGRLAAGAAHEINNPLTIISLNLQIMDRLLAQRHDEVELKERLKVISDQEMRISKIIGDLMGFARPSEPKLGSATVCDCMSSVLSVLGDRVSTAKIDIIDEISPDLPPVFVDIMQIEQVFMNLLINAIHAMPDGGKLVLGAELENNDWVSVSISDNGIGISKENIAKVFDPFFTTKKEGEGTGLGLAVCHSIIEHNGGAMTLKSREGEGSTFIVRLPLDNGVQLRTLKKAVDQKKRQTSADHEVCRILIIDDERLLNEMLQECLKSAGYEADGAYDGVEGIGMLRYKKYHLILLDVRMPRKDGLEVLEFMKNEYPDIPVIIITGLASLKEIKDTVNMGAYACLKKPFVLEKVLATVNKALADKCSPHLG